MKIVLDAMGHDDGAPMLVAGAVLALAAYPVIERLTLTGDTPILEAELKKLGCTDRRVSIVHTTQVVDMQDSGLDAVRRKKDSSISRAVDLVRTGEAEAVVSAGHTGAAVTASLVKLRMLPGIDRPAIATMMPTETGGHVLLCDAGANPDPTPAQLVQNALMAKAWCQHVLGKPSPRVGLMSNGTEDYKGNQRTQAAHPLLHQAGLCFEGNVEGHDFWGGTVDVVVTDGFTGNVMLKISEALAKSIFRLLKRELTASVIRKAGALLCKPGFLAVKDVTNADRYGGSPLLGVNGICIIAHGGSTAEAIKNAIRVACESIQHKINPRLVEEVQRYHDQHHAPAPAIPAG